MVEYELFIYKDADRILRQKGLLQEIEEVLRNIQRVSHREIQNDFHEKNWEIERQIFSQTTWAWDAYKDKVAVSVELSLVDAVHRLPESNSGAETR